MLTYEEAVATLKNRESKKLENNTYLHRIDADTLAVRLHATDVVLIHRDGSYTLNSGDWRTVTTKDRINGYSPASVYQTRFIWFLGSVEFVDGMRVDSSGAVISEACAV